MKCLPASNNYYYYFVLSLIFLKKILPFLQKKKKILLFLSSFFSFFLCFSLFFSSSLLLPKLKLSKKKKKICKERDQRPMACGAMVFENHDGVDMWVVQWWFGLLGFVGFRFVGGWFWVIGLWVSYGFMFDILCLIWVCGFHIGFRSVVVVVDFGLWLWWLWLEEGEERETLCCGGVDCFEVVGVVAMGWREGEERDMVLWWW